jgi:hypothetical protein
VPEEDGEEKKEEDGEDEKKNRRKGKYRGFVPRLRERTSMRTHFMRSKRKWVETRHSSAQDVFYACCNRQPIETKTPRHTL